MHFLSKDASRETLRNAKENTANELMHISEDITSFCNLLLKSIVTGRELQKYASAIYASSIRYEEKSKELCILEEAYSSYKEPLPIKTESIKTPIDTLKLDSIPNDRMFFSMDEFAQILRVSRLTVHRRIKDGTIKVKKLGGRVLIPRIELALLEGESYINSD